MQNVITIVISLSWISFKKDFFWLNQYVKRFFSLLFQLLCIYFVSGFIGFSDKRNRIIFALSCSMLFSSCRLSSKKLLHSKWQHCIGVESLHYANLIMMPKPSFESGTKMAGLPSSLSTWHYRCLLTKGRLHGQCREHRIAASNQIRN